MEQDKNFKVELLTRVKALPGVELLRDLGINKFSLVGGAVYGLVDNIKESIPQIGNIKDYDLFGINPDTMYLKKFKYLYSTEYATTFEKDGMRFQLLKTNIDDFDFTISTVLFRSYCRDFTTKVESAISGDLMNLELKNLVPIHSHSFRNRMNQLARLPHYINKGFTIHPLTYDSLIRETYRCGGGQVGEFKPKES